MFDPELKAALGGAERSTCSAIVVLDLTPTAVEEAAQVAASDPAGIGKRLVVLLSVRE